MRAERHPSRHTADGARSSVAPEGLAVRPLSRAMVRRLVLITAGGAALCLWATQASAYCRTHTCEFEDTPCERDADNCATVGAPLFWRAGCLRFAVDTAGSAAESISADQLAERIEEGLLLWSSLGCEGGSPPIASAFVGPVRCSLVEFNCYEYASNDNLWMFRDTYDRESSQLDPTILGLTTLTANLNTGEIVDADVELNARDYDFTLDRQFTEPSRANPRLSSLSAVVNHELGHFLGLGHSADRGALMWDAYAGLGLPGADDAAGICAIWGGTSSDPVCEEGLREPEAGCAPPVDSEVDAGCPPLPVAWQSPPDGGCRCRVVEAPYGGSNAQRGPWPWWLLALVVVRRHKRMVYARNDPHEDDQLRTRAPSRRKHCAR